MDDLFARYVQNGDSFAVWATKQLDCAEQIATDLVTAHRVLHEMSSPSYRDLVAARDALLRLRRRAFEGGFVDMATIFYRSYERICRLIVGLR